MADPVPLSEVPPDAEFRLIENGQGRVWHLAPHRPPAPATGRGKCGWQRKPCPDAVRVMSRQGGTRWLRPETIVILLKENSE